MAVISDRLRRVGVVPVVELPEAELAIPLADALVAGGLSCVEITFRTPAAQAGLEAVRKAYPDMLLGAGTVFDEEQLSVAVSAGADFVVSPGTNPELVEACLARDIPILPGVCSPSEIEAARGLGLNTVKFFPAEPIGGVPFLRALCGPYREVSFVPTGNITPSVPPRLPRAPPGARVRRQLDGEARDAARRRVRPRPELGGGGNRDRRAVAMTALAIRPKSECRWDLVSLGEVMLRLDPGDGRVATTRRFRVWEGGGEYNVARGLRRCFGLDTAVVTALADNPVGRLIQDLLLPGRRRPDARPLGAVRRRRAKRPQRAQLH